MSSLAGSYSDGKLLSPDEQQLIQMIQSIHTPPVPIDFGGVQKALDQTPPPIAQPVPGVASPFGMFLSQLSANVGSALARRPDYTAQTSNLLTEQRQEKARVQQENTDTLNRFNAGLSKDKLEVLLRQQEMNLEQAINANDHQAARTADGLSRILEGRIQRRNERDLEAQRSADKIKEIAAVGGREKDLFAYKQNFKVEDTPGFGNLSKASQAVVKQMIGDQNNLILANARPSHDPMNGNLIPPSITIAQALQMQRDNAVSVIRQYQAFEKGGGVSKQEDPLGIR